MTARVSRRLFLAASPSLWARGSWSVSERPGSAAVLHRSREVTAFHFDEKWDTPFLYPLVTPGGLVLSRGFPLAPRVGNSNDHAWHRGLFFGHGIVSGHDFWRELGREKTSRLVLEGTPKISTRQQGVDLGGRFAMAGPVGKSIGHVEQTFSLSEVPGAFSIEFNVTVRADEGVALVFGDTDDGGFAFRVHEEFRQDRGARLQNSEGLETTEKIWGKRARWIRYSARIDGAPAAVVIMDHPSNLRYPTRWHARPYGLCAANPFAGKSFTKDPALTAGHRVEAGGSLRLRYCVLLCDGDPATSGIENLHARFASRKASNA